MKILSKLILVRLLLMLCISFAVMRPYQVTAAPAAFELHAGQWEAVRTANQLLDIGELRLIVNEWSMEQEGYIELQYPGGEEGELWVHQLMDRLVALGIPSASLVSVPGSGTGDVIRIQIVKSGDYFR
jgi:hypothetical protein